MTSALCKYPVLSAVGTYAFVAAPVALIVITMWLFVALMVAHNPAAQKAALGILVPICVIPIAAIVIYMTFTADQIHCPGLPAHAFAAILGVLALVTTIACPIALWRRAVRPI